MVVKLLKMLLLQTGEQTMVIVFVIKKIPEIQLSVHKCMLTFPELSNTFGKKTLYYSFENFQSYEVQK